MGPPSPQKQRVKMLEAACHRALDPNAPHDLARQSLLVVLIDYEPKPAVGSRPLVIGLTNVVWAHSQALLQALKQRESPQQRRVLVQDLRAALHELHEAL